MAGAVKWTLPENCWGPLGHHRAVIDTLEATVRKAPGGRPGWRWVVRDLHAQLDGIEGHAATWQAARRAAAAALIDLHGATR